MIKTQLNNDKSKIQQDPGNWFRSRELVRIQRTGPDPGNWSGSRELVRIQETGPDPGHGPRSVTYRRTVRGLNRDSTNRKLGYKVRTKIPEDTRLQSSVKVMNIDPRPKRDFPLRQNNSKISYQLSVDLSPDGQIEDTWTVYDTKTHEGNSPIYIAPTKNNENYDNYQGNRDDEYSTTKRYEEMEIMKNQDTFSNPEDDREQYSYYSDGYDSYNNSPGFQGYKDDSYQTYSDSTTADQSRLEYNAAKQTNNYFNSPQIFSGRPSYSNSFTSLGGDAVQPSSSSGVRETVTRGSAYDPFYPDFNSFGAKAVSRSDDGIIELRDRSYFPHYFPPRGI
ncbi:uncharacterized protein LOC111715640 [Eurytemora carolleeae]|uniref:uncharacterized protein LOC111715640 n=1 Tax=Eurytemora carolleeae TaxID=1294199 RepID=UPI000C77D90B|nr:uncharacterized protein LOC111715640 [Eurytemora carolleeae]|eukprot:XP_023346756.1 uncharacterized protein LOC111715640 [Eurytemora affinis]